MTQFLTVPVQRKHRCIIIQSFIAALIFAALRQRVGCVAHVPLPVLAKTLRTTPRS